jgi:outer membrane protein assembly factor BamB
MQTPFLHRYAVAAYVLLLSGCGGSPAQTAPQVEDASTGITPQATSEDLLYVANAGSVTVYSYPQGTLVGTLNFPYKADGLCADSAGDVYITSETTQRIYEFAHGGKRAIRSLKDPGFIPRGCAVDPVTGNLAVANLETTFAEHSGNVVIYRMAKGAPEAVTGPNLHYYYYCGYDSDGNLFVTGESTGFKHFTFAELPKSADKPTDVNLSQSIGTAGGVQYDGTYIAVGDRGTHAIYEFAIEGSVGTLERTTRLLGSDGIGQFDVVGSTVVVPNVNHISSTSNVLFYSYPAGGAPTLTITNNVLLPTGAVVSVAPTQ